MPGWDLDIRAGPEPMTMPVEPSHYGGPRPPALQPIYGAPPELDPPTPSEAAAPLEEVLSEMENFEFQSLSR